MELQKIGNYFIVTQRQGNDKNGNPIYIINVFDSDFININYKFDRYRLDKYGNIKLTSYNIGDTIKYMFNTL